MMGTTTEKNGNGEAASAAANEATNVNPEQINLEPSSLFENRNGEVHVQGAAEGEYPLTVLSVDEPVVQDDGEADKSASSSQRRISDSDVDVVASKIEYGMDDLHGSNHTENTVVHEALKVSREPSNDCEQEEEKQSCSKDCTQATVSTERPEAEGIFGFDLNVVPVSSTSISNIDASDGDEIDSSEVSSTYGSKSNGIMFGVGLSETLKIPSSYVSGESSKKMNSEHIFDLNSVFIKDDDSSSRNRLDLNEPLYVADDDYDACFQLPNFGNSSTDTMRNDSSSSQPSVLTNGHSGISTSFSAMHHHQAFYPYMVDSNSQVPFSERLNSTQYNTKEVASSNAGSMTLKRLIHDEDSNEHTRLSLGLPGKRKEPEGGLEMSLCTFKQQHLSI